MQPITNQAEQTIAFQQQRLSPYVSPIFKAFVKTYGFPLATVFVANILLYLLNSAVPSVLSGFLGSGISFIVFFLSLALGWRFADNRWHGRELFAVYATVGKARRTLEAEITNETPSDTMIQHTMSEYIQSAEHFIETMQTHNLIPDIIEVD